MLTLAPNETILLVMRRHWIVFAGPTFSFFALLILPPIALLVAPNYIPALSEPGLRPVVNFFLALYTMALLAAMLVVWLSYYLDVWIITNQRIIDIEQFTIFHREVSEISLDRIQNVTVEIPGFIATFLGFGNIKIHTAGEGEFNISEVAEFYRAKDIILQHSRHASRQPTPNPNLPSL